MCCTSKTLFRYESMHFLSELVHVHVGVDVMGMLGHDLNRCTK